MNAKIELRLVGYDRKTEYVSVEYAIPPECFEKAKRVARVRHDDPNVAYNYPLDRHQVAEIATMAGEMVWPEEVDFFLEGFAPISEKNLANSSKARHA